MLHKSPKPFSFSKSFKKFALGFIVVETLLLGGAYIVYYKTNTERGKISCTSSNLVKLYFDYIEEFGIPFINDSSDT